MKKLLVLLAFSGLVVSNVAFASFDKNLAYGAKGASVTEVQEFLTDQGVYSGPITGNFYSLTLKAVKAFQTRENILPKSGYWNLATRQRANEILAAELAESNTQQPTVAEKLANPDLLTIDDAVSSPASSNNETFKVDPSTIRWTNPVTLLPEPAKVTDWCENIFGNQEFVPMGFTWENGNFCREARSITDTIYTAPSQSPVIPSFEPVKPARFFFSGGDAIGFENGAVFVQINGLNKNAKAVLSLNGKNYEPDSEGRFMISGLPRAHVRYDYTINLTQPDDYGRIMSGTHTGSFSY